MTTLKDVLMGLDDADNAGIATANQAIVDAQTALNAHQANITDRAVDESALAPLIDNDVEIIKQEIANNSLLVLAAKYL